MLPIIACKSHFRAIIEIRTRDEWPSGSWLAISLRMALSSSPRASAGSRLEGFMLIDVLHHAGEEFSLRTAVELVADDPGGEEHIQGLVRPSPGAVPVSSGLQSRGSAPPRHGSDCIAKIEVDDVESRGHSLVNLYASERSFATCSMRALRTRE